MQPCFSSIDCVFVAGGFPIAPLTPSLSPPKLQYDNVYLGGTKVH